MKKTLILLFCLLFLIACNKKEEPVKEDPPVIVRKDSEELLSFGNTLVNINGDIKAVETKDYVYYVFQKNTILRIRREDPTDIQLIYENDLEITNIVYYDNTLFFIEKDAEHINAQLASFDLETEEKEIFFSVDSFDNILVLYEEKLYYVNEDSFMERCDLSGEDSRLFGLTLVIHPAFDGAYFYASGYEATASDDRIRVFKTDIKTDTSTVFYDKTTATLVVPNPYGFVIFENSGAQYVFYTTDLDGTNVQEQENYLSHPFTKVVKGNYYGAYAEENTYYEYNPKTKVLTIATETNGNYATWKIYALGVPTEEFVIFETNDMKLYYYNYYTKEIIDIYPVTEK